MENRRPKVSVIIPTYNRGFIIRKSIDSVLKQTFEDFELIIVDDGSTDNTKEVVNSYGDSRIRYIYQGNSGACAARNKGISVAQGNYISFHDSDDEWFPTKLEIQLSMLERTDADIVTCQMIRINEDKSETVIPYLAESKFVSLSTLPPGLSTQTFFMKRKVAECIKFDPNMPRLQDMEWLIRACETYSIYCINYPLVNYEVQQDSISSSLERLYKAIERINCKNPNLKKRAPLIAEELSEAMIYNGMLMLRNNNNSYYKFLLLGYYLSNRKKNKIKYYIVKFHLFKPIHKVLRGGKR